MVDEAGHLGLYNIVKDNRLHELGFNEPAVVSLDRKGMGTEDFASRIFIARDVLEKLGGYRVVDLNLYDSEAVLVVRKKFSRLVREALMGSSEVRELRCVNNESCSVKNDTYVSLSYFNNGECILRGDTSNMTSREKEIVRGYPWLVRRA